MQGSIPITIKADGIPELPELFRIKLTRVELLEGPPANPSNMPQVRVKMNEYRQNECIWKNLTSIYQIFQFKWPINVWMLLTYRLGNKWSLWLQLL